MQDAQVAVAICSTATAHDARIWHCANGAHDVSATIWPDALPAHANAHVDANANVLRIALAHEPYGCRTVPLPSHRACNGPDASWTDRYRSGLGRAKELCAHSLSQQSQSNQRRRLD